MKARITIIVCFIIGVQFGHAQHKETYLKNVQDLDVIVHTLYNVISGDKGQERDWDLFRYIFHDDAKLMPISTKKEGGFEQRFITAEQYIETSGDWLVKNGFFEVETYRIVEEFGQMAQIFSSFEAYLDGEDDAPFMEGINSIQLFNDGVRWWISNIAWVQATIENPIPAKYLKP